MTTCVALLYSIVLTPRRRVVMADLRAMAERLGLRDPRTLAASGNLVFDTGAVPVPDLEGRLEAGFEQAFGRHVDIIVRTAADWTKLAAANPFPADSETMADRVAVRVMRRPVPGSSVDRLRVPPRPARNSASSTAISG